MKKRQKSLSIAICKGADVTEEQLEKVSKYTLEEIPVEDLYVRKIRLAHNAIDRDGERFDEKLLENFALTLPGKALLIGHAQRDPGKGLFFDAKIEKVSIEKAREMTGEDLQLPEGMDKVHFLIGWFYTTKNGKEDLLADIDAGIVRHASIGFAAANIIRVNDEETGETLFMEYKAPGEAREGSLVWLGAQQGAEVTKAVEKVLATGDGVDIERKKEVLKIREGKAMKNILKTLGLESDVDESKAISEINKKDARLKHLEDIVGELGEDVDKGVVTRMKALAKDGEAYREDLVDRQIKAERLLGRLGDDSDKVVARKKELTARSVKEITPDVKFLEKEAFEKFPDKATIISDNSHENRDGRKAGSKKFNFREKKV